MKKAFRLLLSVSLFSTLVAAQLPTTARCQMSLGGVFSTRCAMKCCETQQPLKGCPMMKAETPRDAIAAPAIVIPALETVSFPLDLPQPVLCTIDRGIASHAAVPYDFLSGPPLHARAPPAFLA